MLSHLTGNGSKSRASRRLSVHDPFDDVGGE
jgi:hypothetical protein